MFSNHDVYPALIEVLLNLVNDQLYSYVTEVRLNIRNTQMW